MIIVKLDRSTSLYSLMQGRTIFDTYTYRYISNVKDCEVKPAGMNFRSKIELDVLECKCNM